MGEGERVLGLSESEAAKVSSCGGDGAKGAPASSRRPPCPRSDIINSPKLAGELQRVRLGSLLPPRQIRLLEATFLSNEMVSPALRRDGGGAGRKPGEAWRQDAGKELDRDFHVGRVMGSEPP